MKPIKLTYTNLPNLQQLVDDVNGQSQTDCFSAQDLLELVYAAEARAENVFERENDQIGVRFEFESGVPAASAHGKNRFGNRAVLERKFSGWYLIDLSRTTLEQNHGGRWWWTISGKQRDLLVRAYIDQMDQRCYEKDALCQASALNKDLSP